jgi:hypothetical protein
VDRRSNYQEKDVDLIETWEAMNTESGNQIRNAGLEEVRANVYATGYATDSFHFVEGDILETIPNQLHDSIALLRLDTDWYEFFAARGFTPYLMRTSRDERVLVKYTIS